MNRHEREDRREGFVLAFVVMMLFAISVAGATGYLVVSSEFTMAKYGSQSAEALAVARAGLHRFVAEQIGVVGDSVSYAIGNGIALITTRKLMEKDSLTDVYYIRSEAQVSDVFSTQIPATRVVGAYAIHHRRPLAHHGALVITEDEVETDKKSTLHAIDSSTAVDCVGGGASQITTVVALSDADTKDGDVEGATGEEWLTFQAMYASVGLRWDVLSDPNFPIEFEDSPPNFAALPADSYPVVRYNGSNLFSDSWDGRGVLIVTGEFDSDNNFDWEGIILAGEVDVDVDGTIRGMFVGGLNGPNPAAKGKVKFDGDLYYYSCYVYAANESLSYLELLVGTVFEANE